MVDKYEDNQEELAFRVKKAIEYASSEGLMFVATSALTGLNINEGFS
eukprot:CAMPEP_0170563468 /NCGR_PEP_ID=MMETSP0211-20121228/66827_1 /TAXON_ID=311385 /ORGANISM="Pseudokeronopsis sp., Strain OXSARD2" /LENGTH=46 /DNA_ID= /DNA_START= /DNA_END= /DNA_ORIENTATION=